MRAATSVTGGVGFDQHIGEQVALVAHIAEGLGVAGEKHREGGKGRGGLRDPDEPCAVGVELEGLSDGERPAREEIRVAGLVDDDRIRVLQVLVAAEQHLPRGADQRGVVDPEQDHLPELPVRRERAGDALVERHRPAHPGHPAYPVKCIVGEGLILIEVLRLAVQDPEIGVRDILDLARGPDAEGLDVHRHWTDRSVVDFRHPRTTR
jgi:hypothetical protein